MASKAQLEANSRYLAKKKTITIRFDPDELEKVKKEAEKHGSSLQGYIVQAVRDRMGKNL